MGTAPEGTFRLGPFTAKPRLGELVGPDGTLHLEPKVMGVLACLAKHAGEAVTRDQFIEEVWDGRIVTDEALTRCIGILRLHLGDNPRSPEYIRTVPKIGYQLMKDVEWMESSAPAPVSRGAPAEPATPAAEAPAETRRLPPAGIAAMAAALAVAVAFIAILWPGVRDDGDVAHVEAAPTALAVLPCTNMSGDADNEYLSDGLTEDLINRMANLPGLQVVASTTAFVFKNRPIDVRDVGEQLGVAHVIQCSVRKDGDRVRITASLTATDTTFVKWSNSFDTKFSDIFSVQDEISNSIVEELRPQLAGTLFRPSDAPTSVMQAYELVLRGRLQMRAREQTPIRLAIDLFREAITLDPRFGEAYRDLARAYAILPTYSFTNPDDMFSLAEQTLQEGVEMDPPLRDKIWDVRAFLHYNRWQWNDAEEDFRRALSLTPADPDLHQWYSQLLAAVGKPELALTEVLEARELDILSPATNQRLAVIYQWLDDDEQAHRQFQLASELGLAPTANPEGYAVHLIRHGHYADLQRTLSGIQDSLDQADDWVEPFVDALADPSLRPAAIDALLEAREAGQIHPKYLQGTLAVMGDFDTAIEVAFELLDDRLEFELEFFFARENAGVRQHPRFGELVRLTGLETYWDEYGWPSFCERRDGQIACR